MVMRARGAGPAAAGLVAWCTPATQGTALLHDTIPHGIETPSPACTRSKQDFLNNVTSEKVPPPYNVTVLPVSDAANNTATIKIVSVLTNRDQVKCNCEKRKQVCNCVPGG